MSEDARGPLSRKLRVETIGDGTSGTVEATKEEMAAVASLLELVALERLAFAYRLVPAGGHRIRLTGKLTASVVQTCVVSLDPVGPAGGAALQAASKHLTDRRRFDGLLPLGRYRVGGAQFELYGQPEAVRVMVDPGRGQGKLPPEPPGVMRLVATQLPTDPAAFATAAEAARVAVAALPGVAKVEVVRPPPDRLYAEFDESSLLALGLTPTDLARQIREPLGLAPLAVTVSPTSIGLPADVVSAEKVGALDVAFEGGTVTLASVARIRRAPDHTAPPPGLAITLAEGADRERVRQQAVAALQGVEAAAPLALATH